jgi:hypothetical protein
VSLQVRKLSIWMAGMLLGITALSVYVFADSGSYKGSKHADGQIGAFRDPNLPRGNCSQCHEEHDGDTPNDFGLFTSPDNSLCQASGCHDYEYRWPPGNYYWSYPGNVPEWYNSAHGSSFGLFPTVNGREVRLCVQCHNPHSRSDSTFGTYPSATSFLEERGCYSNGGITGQGCHGNNNSARPIGAPDIYSQVLKSSRHNVEATVKTHSSDWLPNFPYGRETRTINSGAFSGANRHVECVDCHNPHKAISGPHQQTTNDIGGPLLGAWGVEPVNGGPWSVTSNFSAVDFISIPSSKEYQLCLKCHSYFAFGNTPPTGTTDIAREINPANASYHPLEDTISTNSYTSASQTNGFIETMEPPWDNGRHDLMTCSDCHTSDNSIDPKGPHGSNQPYILFDSPAVTEKTFCTKCHKATVYAPLIDPGLSETGSRFDSQTTGSSEASHYYHVTVRGFGCRQCHGARQTAPQSSPGQSAPYAVEAGSVHGSNLFPGLLNGANINSYSPGSCGPTCHDPVTYNAGQE